MIFKILASALFLYALMALLFYAFQRSLMYPGATFSKIETPPNAVAPYENFEITSPDNVTLRGWYLPAAKGMPTLVYFHGNGDNLASTANYHHLMTDKGFGILLTTYRGYSGGTGKPTEQNNYNDSELFIRTLIERGVPEEKLVLYGFSLGTGIATEMALRFPKAHALVLGAPYSTMTDVASYHYKYLPVKWMLKDRYETLPKLHNISMPVLIVNGTEDEIVPPEQGKRLADLLKAEGKDVTFKQMQGRHVNFFFDYGGDREIANWVLSRSAL